MACSKYKDEVKLSVDSIIRPKGDKRLYRSLQLKNDIKVLLISDPSTEKSAAALDVNVGHMCDPDNIPGLAHLCEHMVMVASTKYPTDDEFNKFITSHSGDYDADTCPDHTNYFFQTPSDVFKHALDIFASNVRKPLFTENLIKREINIVNEEYEKNIQQDAWRFDQLEKSTSKSTHAFNKFGIGNILTLALIPKAENLNIGEELKKFYNTWYSSNMMSLCVLGNETLEQLQIMVIELFSDIENKHVSSPSWSECPFGPEHLKVKCYIVPIEDLRTLDITFPTPDLDEHFRTAPGQYLSYIFKQDREGSLLYVLKERGWCTHLDAESRTGFRGFGFFGMDLDLTEEGLMHVDDIIRLVFQYINMLNDEGPSERIFNEYRDAMKLKFHLREEDMPSRYVASLSENLNLFPMEEVIAGDFLLSEWKPEVIQSVLTCFVPDNVRVAVIHKSFINFTDKVEKWYGTEHKLEKIPEYLIQSWKQAGTSPYFKLPPPNEFITTDLEVFPKQENMPEHPVIIKETPLIRVWLKQDDLFQLPRAELTLEFVSSISYDDPLNCNMTKLFVDLFEDAVAVNIHCAEIAGITWWLDHTKYGMILEIGGCSSKHYEFLDKIMGELTKLEINDDKFDALKEIYVSQLLNIDKLPPMDQSVIYMEIILQEGSWTNEELLAATEGLTVENIRAFIPTFLSKLHVECFIHGNSTTEKALLLADIIEKHLKNCIHVYPMSPCQPMRMRESRLMNGCNRVLEVYNNNHQRSCTAMYFQCPQDSFQNKMLLELFCHIFNEHYCYMLNTEKETRLILSCDIRKCNGIYGLRILSESEESSKHAENNIEVFLASMEYVINNMSDDIFDVYKRALCAKRTANVKRLARITARLWTEIVTRQYNFDRNKIELACVTELTRDNLIRFYYKVLHCNSPHRCVLAIRVIAEKKYITGEGSSTDATTDDSDLSWTPNYKKPSKIENITEFKSQLNMFPRVKSYVNISDLRHKACTQPSHMEGSSETATCCRERVS